jgi:hypothetical protein
MSEMSNTRTRENNTVSLTDVLFTFDQRQESVDETQRNLILQYKTSKNHTRNYLLRSCDQHSSSVSWPDAQDSFRTASLDFNLDFKNSARRLVSTLRM